MNDLNRKQIAQSLNSIEAYIANIESSADPDEDKLIFKALSFLQEEVDRIAEECQIYKNWTHEGE